MITHDYFEWREPDEPPFTMQDLVDAVKDLMMQYHVTFDEALRHLQERGIPYNQFLKMSGLEQLIQGFKNELQKQKSALLDQYRLDELLTRLEEEIRRAKTSLDQISSKWKDKSLRDQLQDSMGRRDPSSLFGMDWKISRSGEKDAGETRRQLEDLVRKIQQLQALRELYEKYEFTGPKTPTSQEAERIREKLQQLQDLEDKLQDALEYGDLFNLEAESLEQILGKEAAEAFAAKRDELKQQFTEALKSTGDVDYNEEEDIYKITPGAARKIGEKALKEVYSRLFTDGVGRHHATYTGDGNVEMTTTKPFEFGDSLTSLDLPSSLLNSAIRQLGSPLAPEAGKIHIDSRDFMVHETKGAASTAIVMLIDQSGSMSRFGRFFNAKKLALALDALIRTEYPEDKLSFICFSTFAKPVGVGAIPELSPKPVTMMGGAVNLRIDFSREGAERQKAMIPEHFTNLQKGLELARVKLANSDTRNKSILLITDGAPTAFYEGSCLYLTYPPNERTYEATMREVRRVTDDKITINTFMMGNEMDGGFFGEGDFLEQMHKVNQGRLIYPAPDKLTQYVLKDYLDHKNKIIQI